MDNHHFERMKRALAAEEQSPHPTHKVGALICGLDQSGQSFERVHYNFWPEPLEQHIGANEKLGNASTTIHAEMATLFTVPYSINADIYITDLPCPNCAKTIAHAGIKNVYIDSHTHNTPLGIKIKPYFDTVSMMIFKKAGIGVFEINIEQQTVTCLQGHAREHVMPDTPSMNIVKADINNEAFQREIDTVDAKHPIAACFATNQNGATVFLHARTELSEGLSEADAAAIREEQDKYVPTLQPINRLLVTCASYGFTIANGYIFSSRTPTSREFVNLIGAGHNHLYIGDAAKCRDQWGLKALSKLQEKGILKVLTFR